MSWLYFQDQWALNHKCTFDGVSKLITIGPNSNSINVKADIYSSWKEWAQLYNNAAFLPAIRVSGGDPIGGGAYTGDVYFLINGWRVLIDHSCTIDGVIYSDDFPSPFVQVTGTQIVTNKVSSLVSVIAPTVNVSGLTVPTAAENAAAAWSYGNRTLTSTSTGPTAAEIRQEIDNNSSKLTTLVADTTLIKGYTDTLETSNTNILAAIPNATTIASAVRTELTPELTQIMQIPTSGALTTNQATMLLEMYTLLGLDPSKPLIVTTSSRQAGTINQTIATDTNHTVVTRA